jgi:hypothetical protein
MLLAALRNSVAVPQQVRLLDGCRFEYAEPDGDDSWHSGSAMKHRSLLFAEPR